MSHSYTSTIEYLVEPSSSNRTIKVTRTINNKETNEYLSQDDISHATFVHLATESNEDHGTGRRRNDDTYVLMHVRLNNQSESIAISEEQLTKIVGFFFGHSAEVDANGKIVITESDEAPEDEAPAELSLALDPVIYTKPFLGKSEKGEHYIEAHDKSANNVLRINLNQIDHTGFVENTDDTRHYVIVSNARIKFRILVSTAEQQGIEYGLRGLVKRTSFAELDNLRRIAEADLEDASS